MFYKLFELLVRALLPELVLYLNSLADQRCQTNRTCYAQGGTSLAGQGRGMFTTSPLLSNSVKKKRFLIGAFTPLTARITWFATTPPTTAATGASSGVSVAQACSRSARGVACAAGLSPASAWTRASAQACRDRGDRQHKCGAHQSSVAQSRVQQASCRGMVQCACVS